MTSRVSVIGASAASGVAIRSGDNSRARPVAIVIRASIRALRASVSKSKEMRPVRFQSWKCRQASRLHSAVMPTVYGPTASNCSGGMASPRHQSIRVADALPRPKPMTPSSTNERNST